jgi:hypothetical protein
VHGASKISDPEYVLRMLEGMEGKTNQVKAKAISLWLALGFEAARLAV